PARITGRFYYAERRAATREDAASRGSPSLRARQDGDREGAERHADGATHGERLPEEERRERRAQRDAAAEDDRAGGGDRPPLPQRREEQNARAGDGEAAHRGERDAEARRRQCRPACSGRVADRDPKGRRPLEEERAQRVSDAPRRRAQKEVVGGDEGPGAE